MTTQFTEREQQTIITSLRIAVEVYRKDMMLVQRTHDLGQVVQERLSEQFNKQINEANDLASRLEKEW